MKSILKAVLLDLDGTIVHFTLDYQKIKLEVVKMFVKSGVPQNLFKPEYRIVEIFNKAEEYFNENMSKEVQKRVKELKERAWQVVGRYEMEAAKETRLIDGVVGVLEGLREMGLKLIVITNNSVQPTNYTLKKIGLENFFDIVLTRENTQFMKPHPQPIETALKKLNIQPSEAILVGDSPIDIRSSKEAGVIAIGVTTGIGNEETLRTSGAKYVISSLRELPSIIKGGVASSESCGCRSPKKAKIITTMKRIKGV